MAEDTKVKKQTKSQSAGNQSANTQSKDSVIDAISDSIHAEVENDTTHGDASNQNITEINREFQEKAVLKQAHELNIPYINIAKTPLNPDFLKILEADAAKNAHVIPFFKVGKKVRIATDNPSNPQAQAAVKSLQDKGYEISINLASQSGIIEALKLYDKEKKYRKLELTENVEEKSIKTYEKEISALKDLADKLDTETAEEGLNMLNIGAMKTGASDAHYEPESDTVVVRFRIDGILHKVFEIKPKTFANISRQIKYKSRLSLNVTNVPQDGRYDFSFNERKIDVRVSTIPTPYGESFVCRFLASSGKTIGFEELGFQELALKKIENATNISHGMILTTGPTGSGKTTTLYSLLKAMSSPENKIITLEDPVEYHVKGVTQSQIDEKGGYSFASGLRSILRQDPDTVMIGEIRDLDTAEVSAQAALTGHVLLSTLHTNSAIESIPRLINMGLPAFMVAPAIHMIIGQRLVRKVCAKCSTLEAISNSEKKEFDEVLGNLQKTFPGMKIEMPQKIKRIHGCDACSQTGYKGRIVIAEVLSVNEEIKDLILNNSSSIHLIEAARKEGFITMREDGLLKVAQGLTTIEEVHRATNISI